MIRNDGSIELYIIDQAKHKRLSSIELIKIYKDFKISPETLLDQFMKNIVYEDIDEDTGNIIFIHKIRHVSDMIIACTLLKTIFTNNKELRYTYSLVNNNDGRTKTIITTDSYEDNVIEMRSPKIYFNSIDPSRPRATICSCEIEYIYKRPEITTIWLGQEILISQNKDSGELEWIEVGDITESCKSYSNYLKDLDKFYSL